jgi:hypothetical protein
MIILYVVPLLAIIGSAVGNARKETSIGLEGALLLGGREGKGGVMGRTLREGEIGRWADGLLLMDKVFVYKLSGLR